jgi:hypothetical protein
MSLTNNTIIKKQSREFISSKIGEEVMAMDMESGDYIHFNEVGATIWELLNEVNTIDGLTEKMTEMYDVSKEDCQKNIQKYILHLIDIKLVTI